MTRTRALVSAILASSLAVGPVLPAFAAVPSLTKAEYESCQTDKEGTFRTAIEAITQAALTRSLATFDYKAAVADSWRANGMDEILDKRVDAAVAEVSKETTWWDTSTQIFYKKKSEEAATKVAERVYRSEPIKQGIEAVAKGVGANIGKSLEFASQDAAGPAISCVKAFLATRYGSAVSAAVSDRAESEFNIDTSKGQASVAAGSVIAQSSKGIAGAAIILVRSQLANMAERVGARIAGSILSRLVTVAAGGIGTVLLAMDAYDLATKGVFPIIATEMKSKATKDLVQTELARAISDQIGDHVKELASKSSDHIVGIWQDFRRAHLKTLELAEHNPDFRAFLDGTAPANLPRLDEVVSLALADEGGETGVLKRLADGSLNIAVNTALPQAIDIARDTHSLEAGLKWAAVSGAMLPKVLDLELHRHAKPDDFTKASLARLLSVDDRLAIGRLAGVSREARDTLFELDAADLKSLARALSESELATLSRYLTGLEKTPRDMVLRTVAASPARMQVLAPEWVRDGVLASHDQAAAVDLLLRAGADTPGEIVGDVRLAVDGKVSPVLIWQRHPAVLVMSLIPLLILLLLIRRIFAVRPPRAKPPATTA